MSVERESSRFEEARLTLNEAESAFLECCLRLGEEAVLRTTEQLRRTYPWFDRYVQNEFGPRIRDMSIELEYSSYEPHAELLRINRMMDVFSRAANQLADQLEEFYENERLAQLERDLNRPIQNPFVRAQAESEPAPPPQLPVYQSPERAPPESDVSNSSEDRTLTNDSGSSSSSGEGNSFQGDLVVVFRNEPDVNDQPDQDRAPLPEIASPDARYSDDSGSDTASSIHILAPSHDLIRIPFVPQSDGQHSDDIVGVDSVSPHDSPQYVGNDGIDAETMEIDDRVVVPAVMPVLAPAHDLTQIPFVSQLNGQSSDDIVGVAVVGVAFVSPHASPQYIGNDRMDDENEIDADQGAVPVMPVLAYTPQLPFMASRKRRAREPSFPIASKNEAPRRKIQRIGNEADIRTADDLQEMAEHLHGLLNFLDLGLDHLSVDTVLSRVRNSIARHVKMNKPMTAALFERYARRINECRVIMGVRD